MAYTPKIDAKTNKKTTVSIRKAQFHREPAGRFVAGGSGAWATADSAGAGTTASSLGEGQLAGLSIVIKNLGVASPLDGRIELAAGLLGRACST